MQHSESGKGHVQNTAFRVSRPFIYRNHKMFVVGVSAFIWRAEELIGTLKSKVVCHLESEIS